MRTTGTTATADRVIAAQRGDRGALGELIESHLAMLYNVAGRALNGHADVDDVVQETLLRVVENLPSVREPARFSGWILAIVHRQIAERIRRRRAATERANPLDAAVEVADPAADFADATVLRLGLSGQRRQVVEAVRWLDPDDRFLLSLSGGWRWPARSPGRTWRSPSTPLPVTPRCGSSACVTNWN